MMFTPLSQFDIYMIISLRILDYFIIYLNNLNVAVLSLIGFFNITLILTIFTLIILLNIIGLIPHGFVVTSHFIWSLYLALSLGLGIFLVGLYNYKLEYLKIFLSDIPILLYLLMTIIELFSYVIRINFWYILLSLLFLLNVRKYYLVKKENYLNENNKIIKGNNNLKTNKFCKIVKRSYYKTNSVLGGLKLKDIVNLGTYTERTHDISIKKVKTVKISDYAVLCTLVKYYWAWSICFVMKVKNYDKFENQRLNETFNKNIEIVSNHVILRGESKGKPNVCNNNEAIEGIDDIDDIDDIDGIYCNITTKGKLVRTLHEHEGTLVECEKEPDSILTTFESLQKFDEKNLEIIKQIPISEVCVLNSNIQGRILKEMGGNEEAMKQHIIKHGKIAETDSLLTKLEKIEKFDN